MVEIYLQKRIIIATLNFNEQVKTNGILNTLAAEFQTFCQNLASYNRLGKLFYFLNVHLLNTQTKKKWNMISEI